MNKPIQPIASAWYSRLSKTADRIDGPYHAYYLSCNVELEKMVAIGWLEKINNEEVLERVKAKRLLISTKEIRRGKMVGRLTCHVM